MNRFLNGGLLALLISCGSDGYSASVTVNSTLPEVAGVTYQTINGALTYIKTQAEPREVLITGGGPYNESLVINYSVTVRGSNYNPIVTLPQITGSFSTLNTFGVGLFTNSEFSGPKTFRFENMTFIPSLTNPAVRAIRSNGNNVTDGFNTDEMTVELVNVVVAPNNGSNQPVNPTGLVVAATPPAGTTYFTDDGVFVAGYVSLATTGTVITQMNGTSANADGIVFNPDVPGHYLHLGPGTVISYNKRMGIQAANSGQRMNLVGTTTSPVVLKGNYYNNTGTRNAAFSLFGDDNSLPDSKINMQNVVFDSNACTVIGPWTVTAGTDSVHGTTANKVAFINNGEATLNVAQDLKQNMTFTNSTWVGTGNPTGAGTFVRGIMALGQGTAGGSTGTVSFTDCVIAGNGTAGDNVTGENYIRILAPAINVQFVNSGLPVSGPYSLPASKFLLTNGAVAPTETNVLGNDPQFVLVSSEFTNPNFLDVAQPAYDNAATGGLDLSGYGDYVGASSVNNWSIY